jgi:hypothetical protein
VALDLSAASDVLKVFYLGPIREQLNGATILLSRIERDETVDAGGTTFTVPLHTSRNVAAGVGRAESGTLPTAGQQGYSKAIVPNKYIYGRIQVSGPAIAATRNGSHAFIKAIESEIKGCVRDTKKSVNRQLFGDGRDVLAVINATATSATQTVGDRASNSNPFVHLQNGMTVDVVDETDHFTRLGSGLTVTMGAKSSTGYTITLSSSVTAVAGDYLVLPGSSASATAKQGYQMMGLDGIIDDGNPALLSAGLHGIDATAAANSYWKAQVFEGSTAGTPEALTLERMQEPLSAIQVNSDYSDSDVKFMLSNVWVRDKYKSLLYDQKRFVSTMKVDGGFTGVEFNGLPLVVDTQCQRNRIYYVVPDTLKIFRTQDFDWMDKDGAVLNRVANTDAYEAVLFHYGDLACVTRNANAVLLDIAE